MQSKEQRNEYHRKWIAAHPGYNKVKDAKFRSKHPGYFTAKSREFRASHPGYAAAKTKAYKATHLERYRAQQAEFARNKRKNTPGYKALEYRQYCRKYPDKVRAHQILNRAIRSRKIKRSPCEMCGAKKVHAHHDDYSKPLVVRFLCPAHHKLIHPITKRA
jgi:hypothetical protein